MIEMRSKSKNSRARLCLAHIPIDYKMSWLMSRQDLPLSDFNQPSPELQTNRAKFNNNNQAKYYTLDPTTCTYLTLFKIKSHHPL
jgi:hypothetical protein